MVRGLRKMDNVKTNIKNVPVRFGKKGTLIGLLPLILAGLYFAGCSKEDGFSKEELVEFQKAQAMYRGQKFDDAKDILNKLIAQKPDNIEAGVLRAKIHFFTREYDQAEALLRKYADRDDDNPYVLMWLGKTVAVQEKRNAEAIEIFKTIVERDPENYLARYYLGRCLERDQKLKPALEQYYNALALEYELSKIHQHLGTLLTEMKMTDRAQHHISRVQMLNQRPSAGGGSETAAAGKPAAEKKPAAGKPRGNGKS